MSFIIKNILNYCRDSQKNNSSTSCSDSCLKENNNCHNNQTNLSTITPISRVKANDSNPYYCSHNPINYKNIGDMFSNSLQNREIAVYSDFEGKLNDNIYCRFGEDKEGEMKVEEKKTPIFSQDTKSQPALNIPKVTTSSKPLQNSKVKSSLESDISKYML